MNNRPKKCIVYGMRFHSIDLLCCTIANYR